MINKSKTSGDSDTRHSTLKPNSRWYKHYTTSGAIMDQNSSNSWNQNHNIPHLNATINKTHKVEARIDSGSTICLAGSLILNHIANKSTSGPPMTIRSCHNNREKTQGCYKATINVDASLPYPIGDKQINIHITNNLSSELILGNDFLKESGTAINLRNNTFIPPEGKEVIARRINPILRETSTAIGKGDTPQGSPTNAHQDTYMPQPTETKICWHTSQKTLYTRFTSNTPRVSKQSTTGTTTLGLVPISYANNSQYSKREKTMSTNTGPIKALEDKSIVGGYDHRPNKEGRIQVLNPKAKQKTLSLTNKELTNEHNPPQYGIISEHRSRIKQKVSWIHTPRLKEPRFGNPNTGTKPVQNTQTKVTTNQLEQFDTKDVEQEWISAYQQTIIGNHNAPTSNEIGPGHTTNYHHQPKHITDQPKHIRGSRTQALDVRFPNATTTHNQIEQPTTHNTPIFMVAIGNGFNVGRKRFVRGFRNQNIPDQQLTAWGGWKSSETTTKLGTKGPLTTNYREISKTLSEKTLIRPPAAFTLRLNDNQDIWPQPPKNQRTTSTPFLEWYQPTFQNDQHLTREGNGIYATGLPSTTRSCITESLGPPVEAGPWAFVRSCPNSSTQRRFAFPVSIQVRGLALSQPSEEGTHVTGSPKIEDNQPFVSNPEDTSHQRTKQYVPNEQTYPTSERDDYNTMCGHLMSEIVWRNPTCGGVVDPMIPNQKQKHTPPATDTFTQYPRIMENSNRETVTLSKALLDQWIVRHGAYEQTNDPPNKHSGEIGKPK